jgi:protoporphyrinogen oxidase
MHVLIAGAGIGGLVLAQSLRKQGISFEIFERDVDKNARFQGWAIAMHTYVLSVCGYHVPQGSEDGFLFLTHRIELSISSWLLFPMICLT